MKLLNSYLMRPRLLYILLVSVVASGCVSGPIEPTQQPLLLSVAEIRETLTENELPTTADNAQVLWAGVILEVDILSDTAQVEIMGYPLDRRQRPLSAKKAQGRFIARYEGFVEPLDFPVGRSITVLGSLAETLSGKVGEANYLYPVVNVDETHLWRAQDLPQPTRFTFGIGINLSN